MKTPILISSSALLASIVAITLAMRTPAPPTQAQIDAMVDSRLAARERVFVQNVTPKFEHMLKTSDSGMIGENWSPKTLEELFHPIVSIVETLGEDTSPSDTQPSTDSDRDATTTAASPKIESEQSLASGVVSVTEKIDPALAMHMVRLSRGPVATSADWPVRLFNGERKLIPNKVSDKESHIASLKLIPPALLKDFKLGTTIERDGWFFTDVTAGDSASEKPSWVLVIASRKGEPYLYFDSVW